MQHTMCVESVGPSPLAESCAQLGADDYDTLARLECVAYRDMLRRWLQQAWADDVRVSLRVATCRHDYGTYYEVQVRYNGSDLIAQQQAYYVVDHAPAQYDDVARDWLLQQAQAAGVTWQAACH